MAKVSKSVKRQPARSKTPRKGASAIDIRQQQLAAEEAEVKKQMFELEREIVEAPQRRQEQLRLQQEELLSKHARHHRGDFISSLPDKRHPATTLHATTVAGPRRQRKGERRAAQYKFLALIAVLILLVYFFMRTVPWSSFKL